MKASLLSKRHTSGPIVSTPDAFEHPLHMFWSHPTCQKGALPPTAGAAAEAGAAPKPAEEEPRDAEYEKSKASFFALKEAVQRLHSGDAYLLDCLRQRHLHYIHKKQEGKLLNMA